MGKARGPRQIHPFPARMAPELALQALDGLPKGSLVLDPMCGSGTVVKHAAEGGHHAIGFDLDPLAVLISRVACRRVRADSLLCKASDLVGVARSSRRKRIGWIDRDPETREFVDYWFGAEQQLQLRRLALELAARRGPIADALRVALSRTIITKDRGASLARDVSHSRPHRVTLDNDYDVYEGFLLAAEQIGRVVDRGLPGSAAISQRDARSLPTNLSGRVRLVVTSPPYLNAIDYIRGHRLSLVWLGYSVGQCRAIRANSIGTERGAQDGNRSVAPRHRNLTGRQQSMLDRYAGDMCRFFERLVATLSRRGEAVVVVGDCNIQGVYVRNSIIVERAAANAGLTIVDRSMRRLPASSRYMPPPSRSTSALSQRMRSEFVYRFARSGLT